MPQGEMSASMTAGKLYLHVLDSTCHLKVSREFRFSVPPVYIFKNTDDALFFLGEIQDRTFVLFQLLTVRHFSVWKGQLSCSWW